MAVKAGASSPGFSAAHDGAAGGLVAGSPVEGRLRALQLLRDSAPFAAVQMEVEPRRAGDERLGAPRLAYPATLSPFHRALVHRAAEDLGLAHESETVGEEGADGAAAARRICVTYRSPGQRALARQQVELVNRAEGEKTTLDSTARGEDEVAMARGTEWVSRWSRIS